MLEAAQRIDTVLLDKTGTVTTGEITVESVSGGTDEERRWVGSVEAASEHPIARAIATQYEGGRRLSASWPRPVWAHQAKWPVIRSMGKAGTWSTTSWQRPSRKPRLGD